MRFRELYHSYEVFYNAMNKYAHFENGFERLYRQIMDKYANYDLRWDTKETCFVNTFTAFDNVYRVWKIWEELRELDIKTLTHKQLSDIITRYRLDNDTDSEYKEYGDRKVVNDQSEIDNPVYVYQQLLDNYRLVVYHNIEKMAMIFLPYYRGSINGTKY